MWLWRHVADVTEPVQCSTLPKINTPTTTWRLLTGWALCSQRCMIGPTCAPETIQRCSRSVPSSESSRCQPIWLVATQATGRNGTVLRGKQRKTFTPTRCEQATETVSTAQSPSTSQPWRWLTGALRESSKFSTSLTSERPQEQFLNRRTEWVAFTDNNSKV